MVFLPLSDDNRALFDPLKPYPTSKIPQLKLVGKVHQNQRFLVEFYILIVSIGDKHIFVVLIFYFFNRTCGTISLKGFQIRKLEIVMDVINLVRLKRRLKRHHFIRNLKMLPINFSINKSLQKLIRKGKREFSTLY